MKTLKFKTLTITLLLLSIFVFAQGPSKNRDSQKSLDHLFSLIPGLTDSQIASINTFHDDMVNQINELTETETAKRGDNHEQIRSLHESFITSVKSVLNEEQLKSFEADVPKRQKADFDGKRGHHSGPPEFANDELMTFVRDQRRDFDQELSEAEKSTISEMRTQMEQQRSKMENENEKMSRAEHRAMFKKHLEEIEPLLVIADAHEESLNQIHENIRNFSKENRPENAPECEAPEKMGKHPGYDEERNVHFLLLDPDKEAEMASNTADAGFEIFPNPVVDNFTVRFDLEKEGTVNIELLNKQGELIDVIDSSIRQVGKQSLEVNARGMKVHEVYFIRIHTPNAILIEKFIKN